MTYFIVFIVLSAFIAFFVLLGLRYFALFPLFFLLFIFSHGFVELKVKFTKADFFAQYSLYPLVFLFFFGIFGLLNFLGFSSQSAFFILIGLSIALWYSSYFFNYEDGKRIFKYNFLILLILLLCNGIIVSGWNIFSSLFGLVLLLLSSSFGLLWYGIGLLRPVEKEYHYFFLYSCCLNGLYALCTKFVSPVLGLHLAYFCYFLVVLLVFLSGNIPSLQSETQTKPSLRRILAGERILTHHKRKPLLPYSAFLAFIKETPDFIKKGLEYLNVVFLLAILVSFFFPLFHGHLLHQWSYWIGVVFFLMSSFFLKKMEIFSLVGRFAVALVINFSFYLSLIVFGKGVQTMLPWLIAWNIFCGVLVFYAKIPLIRTYIKKIDLIFWLLTSLVATVLNIILLIRMPLSGQLIFSLIFVYLGIQGVILYYATQLIATYFPSHPEGEVSSSLLS